MFVFQLLWDERLRRNFQNCRKRKEAGVVEVTSCRLGKQACVRGPVLRQGQMVEHTLSSSQSFMYGLQNYLPPIPAGEDEHSVAAPVKWMKSKWFTRPKRLDFQKLALLMDKTLSTRRNMIINQHASPIYIQLVDEAQFAVFVELTKLITTTGTASAFSAFIAAFFVFNLA